MKKICSIYLILCLLLSLSACGGRDDGKSKGGSAAPVDYNEYGVIRPDVSRAEVENKIDGLTAVIENAVFLNSGEDYFILVKAAFEDSVQGRKYRVEPASVQIKDNLTGETTASGEEVATAIGRAADMVAFDFLLTSFSTPNLSGSWIGGFVSKDCRDATITVSAADAKGNAVELAEIRVKAQ